MSDGIICQSTNNFKVLFPSRGMYLVRTKPKKGWCNSANNSTRFFLCIATAKRGAKTCNQHSLKSISKSSREYIDQTVVFQFQEFPVTCYNFHFHLRQSTTKCLMEVQKSYICNKKTKNIS